MKRILFVPQNAQHMTVQEPIYNYLCAHAELDTNPAWGYPRTSDDGEQIRGGKWPWDADLYVFSCAPPDPRYPDKHIYLPHGVGDEVAMHYPRVLVPGRMWHDDYVIEQGVDPRNYPLVGYPRVDVLSVTGADRDRILDGWRSKLNLPFAETVLFAGFYYYGYERENLASTLLSLFNWQREAEVNLIIKPHISTYISNFTDWCLPEPRLGFFAEGGQRRHELLPGCGMPYAWFARREQKGVNWLSPFELNFVPVYHLADAMVGGESSSCIPEFMVLDRPTVAVHECRLKRGGTFGGIECQPSSIPESLDRSLDNPKEFTHHRKRVIHQRIFQPDGLAAERAAKALVGFIDGKTEPR